MVFQTKIFLYFVAYVGHFLLFSITFNSFLLQNQFWSYLRKRSHIMLKNIVLKKRSKLPKMTMWFSQNHSELSQLPKNVVFGEWIHISHFCIKHFSNFSALSWIVWEFRHVSYIFFEDCLVDCWKTWTEHAMPNSSDHNVRIGLPMVSSQSANFPGLQKYF